MGPYCRFCDRRCFCHLPAGTPPEARAAIGSATILATCPAGQAFELEKCGWNISTITDAIRNGTSDAPAVVQPETRSFYTGWDGQEYEEQR